jgi:hypothetical protein
VDRLSELLRSHVQFAYTAWDRIVLNGYIERLQRPANLAYFFHEVAGIPCITPDVLLSRTRGFDKPVWPITMQISPTSNSNGRVNWLMTSTRFACGPPPKTPHAALFTSMAS